MGLGDLVKGIWSEPDWELPDENTLTKEIEELDKQIKTMPKKSREKTRLIYTMANKMQILRLVLHKKKKTKYRPDAQGKWVWIPEEEYEGRKYK
tara:strand:- start:4206 stop:4487 length:282 start_codon:yes stop_codon:yes gene_type:complete